MAQNMQVVCQANEYSGIQNDENETFFRQLQHFWRQEHAACSLQIAAALPIPRAQALVKKTGASPSSFDDIFRIDE
jgi:hypothetical protein